MREWGGKWEETCGCGAGAGRDFASEGRVREMKLPGGAGMGTTVSPRAGL